jgi:ATP-grasp domain-containing protein
VGRSGTAGFRAGVRRLVAVRVAVLPDDLPAAGRRRLPGTPASSPPARGGASGRPARTAPGTLPSMLLLVPRDPLAPRRADPHFADEAAAVRGVPADGDAVYRGWMLRSERYAAMAGALARRGTTLRTSAAQYRTAHELPGCYAALEGLTPESRWAPEDPDSSWLGGGAAVLRDSTESLERSWGEACFVPDTSDAAAARRVADRFLELRGDDLVGGVVVRRFERFTGAEARTWWVGGRCALVTANPDTPDELPSGVDVAPVADAVAGLALPSVTVDLVRRDDGAWRVVELGDGQVSDRPRSTPAADLVGALGAA